MGNCMIVRRNNSGSKVWNISLVNSTSQGSTITSDVIDTGGGKKQVAYACYSQVHGGTLTIYGSNDKTTWTTLYSKTLGNGQQDNGTLETNYRYIKASNYMSFWRGTLGLPFYVFIVK